MANTLTAKLGSRWVGKKYDKIPEAAGENGTQNGLKTGFKRAESQDSLGHWQWMIRKRLDRPKAV